MLRQPAGQRRRVDADVQEPAAGRHQRQPAWPVTRGAEQQLAEGAGQVAGELGVGHAGFLEVHHVEGIAEAGPHGRDRRPGTARAVGHAQPDHPADPVRPQQRGVPGHRRAPVVPGDDRLLLAERVHQPDDIAGQVQDRVGVRAGGLVGAAVPALVRRHGVEAGGGQRDQLMTPGVPGFGEAVQQQHQRAAARLGDVHPQATHFQVPMSDSGKVSARLSHDGEDSRPKRSEGTYRKGPNGLLGPATQSHTCTFVTHCPPLPHLFEAC